MTERTLEAEPYALAFHPARCVIRVGEGTPDVQVADWVRWRSDFQLGLPAPGNLDEVILGIGLVKGDRHRSATLTAGATGEDYCRWHSETVNHVELLTCSKC